MKKFAIILAILSLLALGQASYAADLQKDWYVKLGGVGVFGYTPGVGTWGVDWNFVGGLGSNDPFVITNPNTYYPQRIITVSQNTNGVAPGTSVYLWGEPTSNYPVNGKITDVNFHWETNYDATAVRLEMLMYHPEQGYTAVWSQNNSSYHWDITNVSIMDVPGYQPVFRITVIPEPCGISILLAGLGTLLGIMQRRKR